MEETGTAQAGASPEAEASRPRGEPRKASPALQAWRLVRRRLSELHLPDDAPRTDPGEIAELRHSLAKHGLLMPILIEPDGTVRGGSRRLAALRELRGPEGQAECILLPPGTDPALAQLVENVHRRNLTPIEEAKAYRALLDSTGWTQTRLAWEMRLTQTRVSRVLNLLRAPPELQAEVAAGRVYPYAVEVAYGRKSVPESCAEQVAARVARHGKVNARYTETNVRVSHKRIAPGIRARVFADRVDLTLTIRNVSYTDIAARNTSKTATVSLCAAIQKKLRPLEPQLMEELAKARRKVLLLTGMTDSKDGAIHQEQR